MAKATKSTKSSKSTKATKAPAAPVAEPVKEAPAAKPAGGLSEREVKILTVLAASRTPLTRSELAEKTALVRGWSKVLGAHTKEVKATSLEGRGLIKCHEPEAEGSKKLSYSITNKGKTALEAHA